MFGKFTVNSHDWNIIEQHFKELCPQIAQHYLDGKPEKPWLENNRQKYSIVYSAVYNLCTAKEPRNERTYAFYEKVLEEFIMLCEIKTVEAQDAMDLITRETQQWEGYCELSKVCRQVFQYLDRFYARDNSLQSVSEKSASVYQIVHLNAKRITSLIGEVINSLKQKRQSQSFDDSLLKISTMIKSVSQVTGSQSYTLLLKSIKEITTQYYTSLYHQWQELTPEEYIKNCLALLSFEQKAFKQILPGDDSRQFNTIFEVQMIHKYLHTLLKHEKGLKLFLKEQRIEFLNKIYHLLREYNCIEQLKKFYYNYVRCEGFDLFVKLKEEYDSEKILNSFAEFYLYILSITNQIFESSTEFSIEFRKVMELIIHLHDEEFNIAGRLVNVINRFFTNTNQKSLQTVMIVFDCLTSKDIFIEAYDNDITHRLILNNCPRLEEEIKFIREIKEKCGDNFTESIEAKIKDYEEALALNTQFLINHPELSSKFSSKILGKKFWTLDNKPNIEYSTFPLVWPPELASIKTLFQQFYSTKYFNRHIEHLPLLSSVTLNIKYTDELKVVQRYESKVNLLQAGIIIFIQQSQIDVSQSQICSLFGITSEIFNSQVKIFTLGINPLLMESQGRYRFNVHFDPLNSGLNMQIPNMRKNSKAEASSVDRQLAIQGAIIKSLKSKDKMELVDLIQEVESRLKFFKPSITKIKEAIEKLVEKDYIERTQEDINVFIYKA